MIYTVGRRRQDQPIQVSAPRYHKTGQRPHSALNPLIHPRTEGLRRPRDLYETENTGVKIGGIH